MNLIGGWSSAWRWSVLGLAWFSRERALAKRGKAKKRTIRPRGRAVEDAVAAAERGGPCNSGPLGGRHTACGGLSVIAKRLRFVPGDGLLSPQKDVAD